MNVKGMRSTSNSMYGKTSLTKFRTLAGRSGSGGGDTLSISRLAKRSKTNVYSNLLKGNQDLSNTIKDMYKALGQKPAESNQNKETGNKAPEKVTTTPEKNKGNQQTDKNTDQKKDTEKSSDSDKR